MKPWTITALAILAACSPTPQAPPPETPPAPAAPLPAEATPLLYEFVVTFPDGRQTGTRLNEDGQLYVRAPNKPWSPQSKLEEADVAKFLNALSSENIANLPDTLPAGKVAPEGAPAAQWSLKTSSGVKVVTIDPYAGVHIPELHELQQLLMVSRAPQVITRWTFIDTEGNRQEAVLNCAPQTIPQLKQAYAVLRTLPLTDSPDTSRPAVTPLSVKFNADGQQWTSWLTEDGRVLRESMDGRIIARKAPDAAVATVLNQLNALDWTQLDELCSD